MVDDKGLTMKIRFVVPKTRKRAMIRTSTSEAACIIRKALEDAGYEETGMAGMVKHILFWWAKKK